MDGRAYRGTAADRTTWNRARHARPWHNAAVATKHAHCSYCGSRFDEGQRWPRLCHHCGEMSFLNPAPVAVLLQPVASESGDGLLVIRRGIAPHAGKLALPGGYIDLGESWQQAAARELLEETQIEIHATAITTFDAMSAPDGTVLIFGLAPPLAEADLAPFEPSDEALERIILRETTQLAFPLHSSACARFFGGN